MNRKREDLSSGDEMPPVPGANDRESGGRRKASNDRKIIKDVESLSYSDDVLVPPRSKARRNVEDENSLQNSDGIVLASLRSRNRGVKDSEKLCYSDDNVSTTPRRSAKDGTKLRYNDENAETVMPRKKNNSDNRKKKARVEYWNDELEVSERKNTNNDGKNAKRISYSGDYVTAKKTFSVEKNKGQFIVRRSQHPNVKRTPPEQPGAYAINRRLDSTTAGNTFNDTDMAEEENENNLQENDVILEAVTVPEPTLAIVKTTTDIDEPSTNRKWLIVGISIALFIVIMIFGLVFGLSSSGRTDDDDSIFSVASRLPSSPPSYIPSHLPSYIPSTSPSSIPSIHPALTPEALQTLINFITSNVPFYDSNDDTFQSPTTIQNAALRWLALDLNSKNFDTTTTTAASSNNETEQFNTNILQRYTLATFWYAWNAGDNWARSDRWLLNDTECNWYGVVCSNSNVVVGIELDTNKIAASIPLEVFSLTKLTSLNLATNSIFGTIPTWIGKLTELTSLNLYGNGLGMGGANLGGLRGQIPTELGLLTNLNWLNLWSNSLTGTLPTELGQLTSLFNTNIHDNYIEGLVPLELCPIINNSEFRMDCITKLECDCCELKYCT